MVNENKQGHDLLKRKKILTKNIPFKHANQSPPVDKSHIMSPHLSNVSSQRPNIMIALGLTEGCFSPSSCLINI